MSAFDVYSMSGPVSTLPLPSSSAPPTMTFTIGSGNVEPSGTNSTVNSNPLSTGVTAAIAVVSVLVVICAATAVRLHLWWCMNLRCRVCLIVTCGRRKPQKGRTWDKRLSSAPTFTAPFDITPGSLEKGEGVILDRSPLDRHFSPVSEGGTLVPHPQLQEIGSKSPRYFNTNSIVSDFARLTTPPIDPAPTPSTVVATLLEPAAQPDREPTEPATENGSHPPPAFNTAPTSSAMSRYSNGSGFLSIITLPSFITNDRPRTYSSLTVTKLESPVQPQNHSRKQSSNLSHRFSAADSGALASPVSDGDTNVKKSRPMSAALQIITSALKRNSSTSSSSPSSRRSSKRSFGRHGPSLGAEDEAVIQWKKLPPIPTVQVTPTLQNCPSQTMGEVKDSPTERVSSYIEKSPKPQFFLAAQIPLPPSPSTTLASSVSPLAYAPPSPQEVSPVNSFTTSYLSHFPLPPSAPSTPGSFVFPPLPPSIPSTPRQFSFNPLPPLPHSAPSTPRHLSFNPLPPLPLSTPSTPGTSSFPPLPPSMPSTPRTFSYPSLPPSIPSTPGQSGYPPLPPSVPSTPNFTDKFTDTHAPDRLVHLAIGSLCRLSGEIRRTQSVLTTATTSALPGNNDGPNGDGPGRYIHQRDSSVCSQTSDIQELVLSPRPLFAFPSSPPPPMSPRGPRPRPTGPTQLSRSGTWHSRTSSSGH